MKEDLSKKRKQISSSRNSSKFSPTSIHSLNVTQRQAYSAEKKEKKSRIAKRFSWISLASILGAGAIIGSSFIAVSSFALTNKDKEPEPVDVNLEIANKIATQNPSITVTDSNLTIKKPSQLLDSDFNLTNVILNLNGIEGIDQNLISFKITFGSANDTAGTIWIDIVYNGSVSTSYIELLGFAFDANIQIQIQPTPGSISRNVGDNYVFTTDAILLNDLSLSNTLVYQWYKDGTALTNDSTFSGVNTKELTATNLQIANSGAYICRVSYGSAFVETNAWNISVTSSDLQLINALVTANSTITITDATLITKLPSMVTISELTLSNVTIDSSSIPGFNDSSFAFSSIVSTNDSLGTIIIRVSYNGAISENVITLNGFRTIPNLNNIIISQATGTNSLQTLTNNLATNYNVAAKNINYKSYFTIRNYTTNANIVFDTAIANLDVKQEIVSNKLRLSLTLSLADTYITSSSTFYQFTSASNIYNPQINTSQVSNQTFKLSGTLGTFMYFGSNMAIISQTGNVTTYSTSNLFTLKDMGYESSTFVQVKKIVQNPSNSNQLFFLTTFRGVTGNASQTFDCVFQINLSASAPTSRLLVNLHFKNKESPTNFPYTTSNAIVYSPANDFVVVFPPNVSGSTYKITILANISQTDHTISYVNLDLTKLITVQPGQTTLDGTYNIHDAYIQKSATMMTYPTNKNSEYLILALTKQSDTNKKLFVTAVQYRATSNNETILWYADPAQSGSSSNQSFASVGNNFYNSNTDSIRIIPNLNNNTSDNFWFTVHCQQTNKLAITNITTNGSASNPNFASFFVIENVSLNTKIAQPFIDSNNTFIYGDTNSKDVKQIKLTTTPTTIDTPYNIVNKNYSSLYVNESITQVFPLNSEVIIFTNFGNRYAYNTTTWNMTNNLRP